MTTRRSSTAATTRAAISGVCAGSGQVAVVSTTEARRHLATLAGEAGTTLWRNQVAPRGLLQMMRCRPALDAARLRVPLLVCLAVDDTETPEATASELAERAPHGTARRYPGTHFDFYADPPGQGPGPRRPARLPA
jgi:uncharacterized protein